MTTIATICARGGSKGLPGKNIRPLLNKPLINYTIEQALACSDIDKVYVSTDDPDIAEIARQCGALVPFIRESYLAQDDTPKLKVIAHLVDWVNEHHMPVTKIVDLDPTSPLREIEDISACIQLLDQETNAVITAYPSDKNPYFNMIEKNPDGTVRLVKQQNQDVISRQTAPAVYAMNASIYIWHKHTLTASLWNGNVRLYEMPRERSIDIDSLIDFKLVELLMKEKMIYETTRYEYVR